MKNNQLINKLKNYNFKLFKNINNFNELLYIDEIYKSYWGNGNISSEIPYKNGKRNGLFKRYYINGNIKYEIEYKDGLINGLYKAYYWLNGDIKYDVEYKDSLRNGLCKFYYYKNGKNMMKIMN